MLWDSGQPPPPPLLQEGWRVNTVNHFFVYSIGQLRDKPLCKRGIIYVLYRRLSPNTTKGGGHCIGLMGNILNANLPKNIIRKKLQITKIAKSQKRNGKYKIICIVNITYTIFQKGITLSVNFFKKECNFDIILRRRSAFSFLTSNYIIYVKK